MRPIRCPTSSTAARRSPGTSRSRRWNGRTRLAARCARSRFRRRARRPRTSPALRELGFDIATVASNHTFDQGPFGVLDTIEGLRELGIATTGAGMTLAEARTPAIVEASGLRIGVLAYNAVGPRESWATGVKAGTAFVRISQHYEVEGASPGSPPTEFTSPDYETLEAMQADVRALAGGGRHRRRGVSQGHRVRSGGDRPVRAPARARGDRCRRGHRHRPSRPHPQGRRGLP